MSHAPQFKFSAFLSYAHADKAWAEWLQSRLEAFTFGPDLIGQRTALGVVPAKLKPVFRDRDDFSAGHALDAATRDAMEASAALIVLCSKVSVGRATVNDEIRLFRGRYPDRPVIPVILNGRFPDNFPPALRFGVDASGQLTNQPVTFLAPDLTSESRTLVVAKTIAAIIGVPPDDVYRRARRVAQRTALIRTGVAASVIMLAGGVGFYGWRSKQQGTVIVANQRVIADKDSREREIREIVTREMAKRRGGSPVPGDGQDLAAAVRSLLEQADDGDATAKQIADLLRQGKTDEAIDVQVAAAEARERRAASDSKRSAKDYRDAAALARNTNPARWRDLLARAQKLDVDDIDGTYQHGLAQQMAGNLAEAERAYGHILAKAVPGTHDRRIFWAKVGLGDIWTQRGDLGSAKSAYLDAEIIADARLKLEPQSTLWLYSVGAANERLGDLMMSQGDTEGAAKAYIRKHELSDRLVKINPDSHTLQRDLALALLKLGDVYRAQGKRKDALGVYRDSYALREWLANSEPNNVSFQRDLAHSNEKLGDIYSTQGKHDDALREYRTSLERLKALRDKDAANMFLQRSVGVMTEKIGDALQSRGDLTDALEFYADSLIQAERLASANPSNARLQRDLSHNHGRMGSVFEKLGQPDKARPHYAANIAIAERLTALDPSNATWRKDAELSRARMKRLEGKQTQ